MQSYSFIVTYRPRKENANANALSRSELDTDTSNKFARYVGRPSTCNLYGVLYVKSVGVWFSVVPFCIDEYD